MLQRLLRFFSHLSSTPLSPHLTPHVIFAIWTALALLPLPHRLADGLSQPGAAAVHTNDERHRRYHHHQDCSVEHLTEFLNAVRSHATSIHSYSSSGHPPQEAGSYRRAAFGPGGSRLHATGNLLYFYAITQDCQLVFARWDQLEQFTRRVEVDTQLTYCLPDKVQLHWRTFWSYTRGGNESGRGASSSAGRQGSIAQEEIEEEGRLGLQLLFKRNANQVCTLPVEFPEGNALAGPNLFSYSLRSSLPYSACSYVKSSPSQQHRSNGGGGVGGSGHQFVLEPELSFPDPLYSDVLYFLDPLSSGPFWTVKQFRLDERGYLRHMENFVVRNFAAETIDNHTTGGDSLNSDGTGSSNNKDDNSGQLGWSSSIADPLMEKASQYLVSLDLQRRRLYAAHRRRKIAATTCAYDLLFRPHRMRVEWHSLRHHQHHHHGWIDSYAEESNDPINSLAIDDQLVLFTELNRRDAGDGGGGTSYSTTLFLADREHNNSVRCLLELPSVVKFGLIRESTLNKMRAIPLPTFRSAVLRRSRNRTLAGGFPSRPASSATPATPRWSTTPTRWPSPHSYSQKHSSTNLWSVKATPSSTLAWSRAPFTPTSKTTKIPNRNDGTDSSLLPVNSANGDAKERHTSKTSTSKKPPSNGLKEMIASDQRSHEPSTSTGSRKLDFLRHSCSYQIVISVVALLHICQARWVAS